MVGLLLLKQIENLSDEAIVERWVRDPYYQYFCGKKEFQWDVPCDPSDLIYFRRRIGSVGVTLILAVSAQLHGSGAEEKEVLIDTTVQEKNITHPTDTKLARKIIQWCWKLADEQGVTLRRRYRKDVKSCLMNQRWRRTAGQAKRAGKSQRRLKTIAGALIRELERKLPNEIVESHKKDFGRYRRVLAQKRQGKNKKR